MRVTLPAVISDERSGKAFIQSLEVKGFTVGTHARKILLSEDFRATTGVRYDSVMIGKEDFNTGLPYPPIEFGALLRECVTDELMAKHDVTILLVRHAPVILYDNRPWVLGLCRDGGGKKLAGFSLMGSIIQMPNDRGIAYLVP